jgi:Peptidase family M41/ATPase family associated with various cellular activities (AAA)/AAA+ lid domain
VRDLFKEAKESAPAIFIDELDAIGRSRTSGVAGFSGGNDEREQTLNQILTKIHGFDPATNVIVLAATNRPDVLDQALLRPGRFDRQVAVQPPDRDGREAILRVHTRGIPLGPDVDLARIAATTPGMVGADLANLVNEAALTAARRGHDVVEEADVTDALERIVLGAERQVMMSYEDRRRTAYHEGGHAIVGMLTPGADPVRKVSIIPRGMALGVTFSAPDADRFSYLEPEILAKIKGALGARAAEEIVFGEISTGAESDLEQLTALARQMVGRWGMSDVLGPISVIPRDGSGPFLPGAAEAAPETRKLVDDEVAPHRRRGTRRGRHPPDGESGAARCACECTARAGDAGRGRRLRRCRCHATPGDPGRRARRGGTLQDVGARSSNGAAGCLAASRDEQLAHSGSVAPDSVHPVEGHRRGRASLPRRTPPSRPRALPRRRTRRGSQGLPPQRERQMSFVPATLGACRIA